MKKKVIIALVVIIIVVVAIIGIVLVNKAREKKEVAEATKAKEKAAQAEYEREMNFKADYTAKAEEFEDNLKSGKKDTYMSDYLVIGVLEIPKIDLKIPVLDRTTSDSLDLAVTLFYTADDINKSGMTVLYGHNYKNSLVFSRIDELSKGDEFTLVDAKGKKVTYEVYKTETVSAVESINMGEHLKSKQGKTEICLSTATDDAEETDNRYQVFCRKK